MLGAEGPPRGAARERHRTAGQIEVQRTDHIEPRGRVGEEPEPVAGAGVDVEEVVAAVRVPAEVQAEDAVVAQMPGQPQRGPLHLRVGQPAADRGQARTQRPGALLAARAADQTGAAAGETAVEEPVGVRAAGQPALKQQGAARAFGQLVQPAGVVAGAHQRGAAQPGGRCQQPRPAPFGDQRQSEFPGRVGGLLGAGGEGGRRVRQVQFPAQPGDFGLVGEPLGQAGGLGGEEIAAQQRAGEPGRGDRAPVVQRDEDGGPADALGDGAQ